VLSQAPPATPMAALRLPPVVALRHVSQAVPQRRSARSPSQPPLRSLRLAAAHTVQLVHGGKTHTLRVDEDESILEVALDAGIDVPHDCKARLAPSRARSLRRYHGHSRWLPLPRPGSAATWHGRARGHRLASAHPHSAAQMGVCMTCPAKLIRCAARQLAHASTRCVQVQDTLFADRGSCAC